MLHYIPNTSYVQIVYLIISIASTKKHAIIQPGKS